MVSDGEASKYDVQAEQELVKAAAATHDRDRKLHLGRAAQYETAAALVRRQISSSE
jgi:hypothetical protein